MLSAGNTAYTLGKLVGGAATDTLGGARMLAVTSLVTGAAFAVISQVRSLGALIAAWSFVKKLEYLHQNVASVAVLVLGLCVVLTTAFASSDPNYGMLAFFIVINLSMSNIPFVRRLIIFSILIVAHAVALSGRPRREVYARALELAKDLRGGDGED